MLKAEDARSAGALDASARVVSSPRLFFSLSTPPPACSVARSESLATCIARVSPRQLSASSAGGRFALAQTGQAGERRETRYRCKSCGRRTLGTDGPPLPLSSSTISVRASRYVLPRRRFSASASASRE